MVLLFPPLLSIMLIWCKRHQRGAAVSGALSAVAAAKALFSVLLAPVRALHTVFVVSARSFGWEVVWNSPQRDDDSEPPGSSLYASRLSTAAGVVWRCMAWLDLRFSVLAMPIVFR